MSICSALAGLAKGYAALLATALRCFSSLLRSRAALAAENEFLRLQLAKYVARGVQPTRLDNHERLRLALLSRFCDWRKALAVVKPETLLRWHRNLWRLYWRHKNRGGRPPLPPEIRELIRQMAWDNRWGEERIAAELLTKLGISVSPSTVRKYLPRSPSDKPRGGGQHWSTFVRNHAGAIVACDFCTAVTATFHVLYVFVVMEVGSRRLLHLNVTAHPTAAWTLQQLREALPGDHHHRFLIHDRDAIYSPWLDDSLGALGVRVLRTPRQTPQANTFVERLIGTMRRECLDHLLPLGESHLRRLLHEWRQYYNRARPHASLGPGFPEQTTGLPAKTLPHRHRLPNGARVAARPILAGLHHDYRLQDAA